MARLIYLGTSSAEEAATKAREVLDSFESRYGVSSERRVEVFLRPDGTLEESEEFHAWDDAWVDW